MTRIRRTTLNSFVIIAMALAGISCGGAPEVPAAADPSIETVSLKIEGMT